MQIGEPRKIYEHPVNKFVADFIGDSTFLPVTMSSGRVMYRDTVLDTAAMPDETGNALLMLRPERLQIVTDQACEAMNRFTGTVRGIIYQGDSYLLQVELADDLEVRSEEHTSELQSLMRISYAVFCLNTKTI